MISFYMIITTLVTAALAKGALECKLSEPTEAQQCFGAVGKPFIFYLPTNRKEKTHLKRNDTVILKVANDTAEGINDKYSNRSVFFINGTFKFDKVTKTDSGDYQLLTFNRTDGRLLRTINFHLEILAPVSQPVVSQLCLSPEKMKVSCSSEGDAVELILTLDNNTLIETRTGCTDKHHTPNVSNVTISLHGQLTGNLMCNVRNNVSREETVIHLKSCKASISQPSLVTVAVISSVTTLLLLLALIFGIKHLTRKTRPMTVNEDNTEDEIVYSVVRTKPRRKTRPTIYQNAT